MTVPSNGYIVVSAQVRVRIDHTSGTEDYWVVTVGASATDCAGSPFTWIDTIEADVATDYAIQRMGSPQRFYLVSAGTYTYYLNGYMIQGQDPSDVFSLSNMVAVFYPS